MGWGEAAQVAQVFAVPITAIGIIVSLTIGIGTLRELRAERLHRVRPILRFPNGGHVIPVELSDSNYLPGFDPRFVLSLTANRPKGNNRLDATSMWGQLTNYGSGAAFDTKIMFLYYRVFVFAECFVIDKMKREEFPYRVSSNTIPASPSHLPPGEAAVFRRLPTPIVVDYERTINRVDAVISIEYEDSFKLKHQTRQAVIIFTDNYRIQKGTISMTFLEEVIGDTVDSTVFGPPETTPMIL
jgi:hypothetical protein